MNTPPKKRRCSWEWTPTGPVGNYVVGLGNPDYASLFANIMSEFNHLETSMPKILTVLLGMTDDSSAGYVYRAIRSVNSRYEVMKALLEKAPINVNKTEAYDELLSEFDKIRVGRNDYAHGLWFTHVETGKVFLEKKDEHGFAFMGATEEPIENLQELLGQIRSLTPRIMRLYMEGIIPPS
jgi:hypothetical protein